MSECSIRLGKKNQTFQEFGLWLAGEVNVTGVAEPERVESVTVTYGTLQALGVPPAFGRSFSEADDTRETPETVILTNGYWSRRFGGDTSIIGQSVTIDSRPREIIGVMPPGFRFPDKDVEVILPLRFPRGAALGTFNFNGIARLRSGVSREQANTDVERMLAVWLDSWRMNPRRLQQVRDAQLTPQLLSLTEDVAGEVRDTLWIVFGMTSLVLLIACANVTNLFLVRAEGRRREFGIRAALGAGWRRIARVMLLESIILGILGGILGLGLAYASLRFLLLIGPAVSLPRLDSIEIDPVVLAVTLIVSILLGGLCGLVPVLRYSRTQIVMGSRVGGHTLTAGRQRHRVRGALVVGQLALAVVLLTGCGLMLRTFQTLVDIQPGFSQPSAVQMLRISVPVEEGQEFEEAVRMQIAIRDQLAAIPGVRSVSFGSAAPMEDSDFRGEIHTEDALNTMGQPSARTWRFIAPDYFQTLGAPILAGRDFTLPDLYDFQILGHALLGQREFTSSDLNTHRSVAIISENLARELWGTPRTAVGKRIRSAGYGPWSEVIGVAGDISHYGLYEDAPRTVYWPILIRSDNVGIAERVGRSVAYMIRSDRADTETFLGEIRQAVWSVNDGLPLMGVQTLGDLYRASMARTSSMLVMSVVAGAIGLVLALLGTYGLIAFLISQRSREIGIRMALGERVEDLTRTFVSHGLILCSFGVVIGLASAAALTRLMDSLLFEISPLDPIVYGSVAVLLVFAVTVASYISARRVASVQPLNVLRRE